MTVGRSYYELIPQALTGSETSAKSSKLKLFPTRKSGAVVTVPNPTAVGTPDNADSVFVQVSGTFDIDVRISAGGPASEHGIQVWVLSGSITRAFSDANGAVLTRSGAGLVLSAYGLKLYAGDLVYVVLTQAGSGTMPAPTQGSVVFVCWSRAPLSALAKTAELVASTDRVNVGDNDYSAGSTDYTGATLTSTTAATQTGTTNFGSSRAGLLEWTTPWEVTGSGGTGHALRLYPTGTTDADPRPVCWVQDCMSTGTNSLTNTAGCESPTTARLVTTCYGESNGTVTDPLSGVDAISVLQMWRHRILVRAGNEIDASRLWAASGAARAGSQSVRVRAGMHVAYRSVQSGGVVGTQASVTSDPVALTNLGVRHIKPAADVTFSSTTRTPVWSITLAAGEFLNLDGFVRYNIPAANNCQFSFVATSTAGGYVQTSLIVSGAPALHEFFFTTSEALNGFATTGNSQLAGMKGFLYGGASGGVVTFQANYNSGSGGTGTVYAQGTSAVATPVSA